MFGLSGDSSTSTAVLICKYFRIVDFVLSDAVAVIAINLTLG
jgi:hypothetical protein